MRRIVIPLVLALGLPVSAQADEVVVFAAASLKTALDQIGADFGKATGNTVTISYAGSNKLATQIIAGAPADIFISAAENWMDEVEKAGLVVPETRSDLLGNTLVLVAHGAGAPQVEIGKDLDLNGLLADGKLAMAMVDSVRALSLDQPVGDDLWWAIGSCVAIVAVFAPLSMHRFRRASARA